MDLFKLQSLPGKGRNSFIFFGSIIACYVMGLNLLELYASPPIAWLGRSKLGTVALGVCRRWLTCGRMWRWWRSFDSLLEGWE
ncbi:hypothetical protein GOBAR_AA15442 [Gossypium barbadense]|uniref:Uncharacterized protein n=1 Tax=Gossypium barbadense TaxID=3634 RepID=A0A2P5XPF5_GOSBA|nr:hypothetical protein GOBAR_AA15442 [Gossypium barbadense]